MTISIFGHRHPLMWVDQSESWFPAKHAHVRRHQTQHILCQQRLSYLRSTSNYFLVVAWFFYFFIEKADFFSKIQTFWRKRRPYLCVFFKKVLFADQSPLKRTQLVSLLYQFLHPTPLLNVKLLRFGPLWMEFPVFFPFLFFFSKKN